eukprot:TRINITY_DN105046_c1_g1_i1.p4 TRINITY_DN105046_c1_g1~~TRINITY_DN105046_c1_g1_i1.p4  ORF type:complete len:279 (+),score=42.10 TRINITY_DN105046_c1_g1_i1:544-1380(+)
MREMYRMQMTQQRERENFERRQKLEDEKRKLAILNKQLEEERKQKNMQKEYIRQDLESMLNVKKQQKEYEKELQRVNQEECKKLMQENANKEIEREKRYRQFFANYDKCMNNRLRKLQNYVESTEGVKNSRLQEWVQKNEETYQKRQKELEENLRNWRKNVTEFQRSILKQNELTTYGIIRQQMSSKEMEKEQYKRSYHERAAENLKLVSEHNAYLEQARAQRAREQNEYSNILDAQIKVKNNLTSKYGTMTDNEKKINKRDLSVIYKCQIAIVLQGV